jgi:hypothetical protein
MTNRNRLKSTLLACLVAAGVLFQAGTAGAELRLGGGVHYLHTLGDIKDADEFDENAIGIMASVTYGRAMFRVEADVEFIPDFGGSEEAMWQPQAYALVGGLIYGGVGAGIGYIDGDWQSQPFFALRAGADFVLADLDLDAFATYRFQKEEDLKALGSDDLDTITFGLLIRFEI